MTNSFENQLKNIVNQYQANGVSGTQYKTKSYSGETLVTKTDMTPEVFNLCCALKDKPSVTPHKCAAWLRDSTFEQYQSKVVFRMRSAFFCENAAFRFKDVLEAHFGKPVEFVPCPEIKAQVNQRVA